MNKTLVIIGAGGHGRVIEDIAVKCVTYEKILFLDDNDDVSAPTAGKVNDFVKYLNDSDFIIAVGNNAVRECIYKNLQQAGAYIATLIHPNAVIAQNVNIGHGTVVMAGVVINMGASIGDGVIVNTCSSVDHDCVIDNFCHVAVGVHIAGTVTVGKGTLIGAGATVINNINICDGCTIGAGGVVVKDITESDIYIGVPARKKSMSDKKSGGHTS